MSGIPSRLAHIAAGGIVAASLAACGSAGPDPAQSGTPDAPPLTQQMNEHARTAETGAGGTADPAAGADGGEDPQSESRVLAYVNGEVVNYRDVLLRIAPQLAVVGTDQERRDLEQRTLLEILRERMVHRAALDAGIDVSRDDLDKERERRIRELEKNGGTFPAFLSERGMTRREFDEQILREIRMQRYLRAAVGLGGEGSVYVRAVTDTFPAPRELRAYYDRNTAKFMQPERAQVRVLSFRIDTSATDPDAAVAEALRRAEAALARLRAGEDWVPVFREANAGAAEPDPKDGLLSSDESPLTDWIREFAFTQPRGTLSARPEKRGPSFKILRAEGYTPARQLPFEEVHPRIQDLLQQLKRSVATYEVELSLLEEAAITPRPRYDQLRDYLVSARKRMIVEAGL